MKRFNAACLLRSPAARLAPWTAFYLAAALGGSLHYYIAPWQQGVIWVSAAALLLLWLSAVDWRPRPGAKAQPLRPAEALEGLAHWAPLLLLLLIGPTELSAAGGFTPTPLPEVKTEQTPPPLPEQPEAPGLPYRESGFIELYTLGPVADGMPVRLLGRLTGLEQGGDLAARARAGGVEPRALFYRFGITCCAADGQMLAAVLVDSPVPGWAQPDWYSFIDTGWVEVQGEARYIEADSPVLAIVVHQISNAEPPDEPYEYSLSPAPLH